MLIFLCLFAYSYGVLANDWEYRISPMISGEIIEDWSASISYESRWDDEYEKIRHHTDIGLIYTGWKNWLDVSANVRQISRRIDEDWNKQKRYYLSFTARQQAWDIGFSHRVRLEYNNFNDRFGDFGTVRYQIAINPPYELKPIRERRIFDDYNYRPYVKYELSFNTLGHSISSQSFLLGLSLKLTDQFITNLYCQRKLIDSRVEDIHSNILGLKLKFLF